MRTSEASAITYNLACIESLASIGKDGPDAEPRRMTEAEAAALREKALGLLEDLAALGLLDVEGASKDPDLEPVRSDPRWQQVLRRQEAARHR